MKSKLKYKAKKNIITIAKCPKVLTKDMSVKMFNENTSVNSIYIKKGIEIIAEGAFENCSPLREIRLPNSLREVGARAFYRCQDLEKIEIPDNVSNIGDSAFYHCSKLKELGLPNDMKRIGDSAFYNCYNLEVIELPNTIEIIDNNAFYCCTNLKKVHLSNKLKKMGESVFENCSSLEKVVIPEGITKIDVYSFRNCTSLIEICFPNDLKEISNSAFSGCIKLERITIPDEIVKINDCVFEKCSDLKEIVFSNNLKEIGNLAFCNCKSLEKIEIPEGVEYIGDSAFANCSNLKKIYLPSTLNHIGKNVFINCQSLEKIILKIDGKDVEIDVKNTRFINNDIDKLYGYDSEKDKYWFYIDGKYTEFDKSFLESGRAIRTMIKRENITEEDYIKAYHWVNRKFIPHYTVIKNMPINCIDNYYANNNCKEWGKLLEIFKAYQEENKGSFFKVCYVLGVFHDKVSIRERAIKFVVETILGNMNDTMINRKFNGFDLNNGYNNEYAEFFMKYFDKRLNFMLTRDDGGKLVDLTASSYNNFDNVKKDYPSKVVNTNRKADILLPEHVMDAVMSKLYKNVDKGNEKLAKVVGKYGYSQAQFQRIQEYYNIGKSIKDEDMKLFIKDDQKKDISYTLLKKDDPLGAVLGNITNCCQVLGGDGESCVRYGMSKPNSKFMIFEYNNTIIGEAWVWYDETTGTVCLDNIELAEIYCGRVRHNFEMRDNLVNCLKRMANNFVEEMESHGLKVRQVTIGQGHNSIKEVLDKNFELEKHPSLLKNYIGYTDASEQYIVIKNKK